MIGGIFGAFERVKLVKSIEEAVNQANCLEDLRRAEKIPGLFWEEIGPYVTEVKDFQRTKDSCSIIIEQYNKKPYTGLRNQIGWILFWPINILSLTIKSFPNPNILDYIYRKNL